MFELAEPRCPSWTAGLAITTPHLNLECAAIARAACPAQSIPRAFAAITKCNENRHFMTFIPRSPEKSGYFRKNG
jgi:hypothetical protein